MKLEGFNNCGKKAIGRGQLRVPDVSVRLSFTTDFNKIGCGGMDRRKRVRKFAGV
jgi:hypothetical protein